MKRIILLLMMTIMMVALIPSTQATQGWCENIYQKRIQINVINNNASSMILRNSTIFTDLNTLSFNQSQNFSLFYGDCTQIDIVNETPMNRSNTRLAFPIRSNIITNDSNYYIYFAPNNIVQTKNNKSAIYNFSEDFESYTLDTSLNGQNGWIGINLGTRKNFYVVNTSSSSGSNSLNITNGPAADISINRQTEKFVNYRIRYFFMVNGTVNNNGPSGNNGADIELQMFEGSNTTQKITMKAQASAIVASAEFPLNASWFNTLTDRINVTPSTLGSLIWHETIIYANKTQALISINQSTSLFSTTRTVYNNFVNNISINSNGVSAMNDNSKMYVDDISISEVVFPLPTVSVLSTEDIPGNITNCSFNSPNKILNFTFYDEDNFSKQTGTIEASFSSNITNSNVTSFITTGTEIYLCTNKPNDQLNATIKYYIANLTGNPQRWYYLINAPVSNGTLLNYSLYTIDGSKATNVEFTADDSNQNPVANVIIAVNRYYPGTDSYRTVAMGKTGFDGKVVIPVKLLEFYKIFLSLHGIPLITTDAKMISETAITIFTAPTGGVDFFSYYNKIGYSCSYNGASHVLICSVADTSGCVQQSTLGVEIRKPFNYTVSVCTDTETGGTTTNTCNLTSYYNNTILNYKLTSIVACSGKSPFPITLTTGVVGAINNRTNWGLTGVFIGFFLFWIISAFGFYNPPLAIVLGFLSLVIGTLLGFMPVQWSSIMALGVAIAIIVYRMVT